MANSNELFLLLKETRFQALTDTGWRYSKNSALFSPKKPLA